MLTIHLTLHIFTQSVLASFPTRLQTLDFLTLDVFGNFWKTDNLLLDTLYLLPQTLTCQGVREPLPERRVHGGRLREVQGHRAGSR